MIFPPDFAYQCDDSPGLPEPFLHCSSSQEKFQSRSDYDISELELLSAYAINLNVHNHPLIKQFFVQLFAMVGQRGFCLGCGNLFSVLHYVDQNLAVKTNFSLASLSQQSPQPKELANIPGILNSLNLEAPSQGGVSLTNVMALNMDTKPTVSHSKASVVDQESTKPALRTSLTGKMNAAASAIATKTSTSIIHAVPASTDNRAFKPLHKCAMSKMSAIDTSLTAMTALKKRTSATKAMKIDLQIRSTVAADDVLEQRQGICNSSSSITTKLWAPLGTAKEALVVSDGNDRTKLSGTHSSSLTLIDELNQMVPNQSLSEDSFNKNALRKAPMWQ